MKKIINNKKIKYLLLIITFLWTTFSVLIFYMKNKTGHIILIDLFGTSLRQVDIIFITILIYASWFIFYLIKFWKKFTNIDVKILIVFGWIILILGMLITFLDFFISHAVSSYYSFISPDKKHTLVVEESSILILGSVSIYERLNPLFIEDLDISISLDDGFTPIYADEYWIKWKLNRATLALFDSRGTRLWTVINVSLGDEDKNIEYETLDSEGNPLVEDQDKTGKTNDENSNNVNDQIKDRPLSNQEILDNLSLEYAIRIPDSNYGLIQIDKAMARILWYFVKIENDRMIYISDGPDTAPNVEGKIDDQGKIYLKFTDINNNQTYYQSLDQGRTWKESSDTERKFTTDN